MLLKGEGGCEINAKDKQLQTPLMMAENVEIVDLLLKFKAKIDLKDITGKSALYIAVVDENFEVSKTLLENGAKFDLREDKGETAADVIKKRFQDLVSNVFLNRQF